jgi:hypothetical protein
MSNKPTTTPASKGPHDDDGPALQNAATQHSPAVASTTQGASAAVPGPVLKAGGAPGPAPGSSTGVTLAPGVTVGPTVPVAPKPELTKERTTFRVVKKAYRDGVMYEVGDYITVEAGQPISSAFAPLDSRGRQVEPQTAPPASHPARPPDLDRDEREAKEARQRPSPTRPHDRDL